MADNFQLQAGAGTPLQSQSLKHALSPSKIGRDKWTKYCEISREFRDHSIIHGLIDVFFGEANWYFTVLDRYYFDNAHRSWLSNCSDLTGGASKVFLPDDLCFPALLYHVIAIGVHFTPERSLLAHEMAQRGFSPSDKLSRKLSDAGDTILDLLGRHHHSIIAVQADLMRCAWLKNSGHGAEAWFKLGNAIRYDFLPAQITALLTSCKVKPKILDCILSLRVFKAPRILRKVSLQPGLMSIREDCGPVSLRGKGAICLI